MPPIASSNRGKIDPLSRAVLARAIDEGVLDECRSLGSFRCPLRLPRALSDLWLSQAVLSRELLAHDSLRTLRVPAIVASAPLRHDALTRFETACIGPGLDLLESAEFPRLEGLRLERIGLGPTPAARVAAALERLRARGLTLGIAGRVGDVGWTVEDMRALRPFAERIEGLTLESPFAPIDFDMPNLRRLVAHVRSRGPMLDTFDWPDLPSVDELHVFTTFHNIDFAALVRTFHASKLARRLRVLHWEFSATAMQGLADHPMEALEELSLLANDSQRGALAANAILERGRFPRLRAMTLRSVQQIAGLAASPLAAQIERLSVPLSPGKWLDDWTAVRPRLTSLKTLIVQRPARLTPEQRVAIADGVPQVIWGENSARAVRRYFHADRGIATFGANQ